MLGKPFVLLAVSSLALSVLLAAYPPELSPNFGDGRGQAAAA
jgi:hypothetical protein